MGRAAAATKNARSAGRTGRAPVAPPATHCHPAMRLGHASNDPAPTEPATPILDDGRTGAGRSTAYFQLETGADGSVRFLLRASNHRALLHSPQHPSLIDALEGIERVRAQHGEPARYQRRTNRDGSLHFELHDADGLTIGVSPRYAEESTLERAIRSVMRHGQTTFVKGLG